MSNYSPRALLPSWCTTGAASQISQTGFQTDFAAEDAENNPWCSAEECEVAGKAVETGLFALNQTSASEDTDVAGPVAVGSGVGELLDGSAVG